MEFTDTITPRGDVEIIIDHDDGRSEVVNVRNTILHKGKEANASALANQLNDTFDFYIDRMLFGTNGTSGGVPLYVDQTRNGLFGTTLLSKTIIASVNPNALNQVIFTTVVTSTEGNGNTVNEIALQMKSGDLYSMVTLGGISKTASMQITFNWRISFS